jgi:hypothetical protein
MKQKFDSVLDDALAQAGKDVNGVLSVPVTLLSYKAAHPQQDIRCHQESNLENMKKDKAVKYAHKLAWNKIIRGDAD